LDVLGERPCADRDGAEADRSRDEALSSNIEHAPLLLVTLEAVCLGLYWTCASLSSFTPSPSILDTILRARTGLSLRYRRMGSECSTAVAPFWTMCTVRSAHGAPKRQHARGIDDPCGRRIQVRKGTATPIAGR
jgi:hypothetical protein